MPKLVLCGKDDADNYLIHFRTKGSKNGVRLYQYKDGSLTPLGREHYGIGQKKKSNGADDKWNDHKVTVDGKTIDIDSKYVYGTGTGMKMSLVGRIKYGKKVSDEYDRTHKDLESREKIENDFKRLSEEEDANLFSSKFFNDEYDGEYTKYARNALKNFDKLPEKQKNQVANEILLRACEVKEDDENSTGYRFVADRVDRLGGNLDTGNFKEGSKSEKAYSRYRRTMDELENGYQAYENHKTWNDLSGAKLFKALREAEAKAADDVFGAVLQDIGFPDTSTNRMYISLFVSDVYRW